MGKKKLLILQNQISSYNVSTYNVVAEEFDLTVGYYQKDGSKIPCGFQKIRFDTKKVGPLLFIKGLCNYCKTFDVVITMPDMHVVSYCILPFIRHRFTVISWSIGFRVSYQHPYVTERKHILADWAFQKILAACDANIFYMEKSKEFWRNTDLDMSKVFIAPNTTDVESIEIIPENKQNFLFVGTLYKGKGLDLLLHSYKEAIQRTNSDKKLVIVGGGEMKDEIVTFVKENHLEERVVLTGPIYDETVLAEHFQNALLCISPTQGGLSCPKSMGYGVPFICRKDAITGGEIYHMTSGVNGIMYEKDSDLTDILVDAINNPEKYVEMGIKAKDYYDNNATIKHMAQGAIDAVNYTLSK